MSDWIEIEKGSDYIRKDIIVGLEWRERVDEDTEENRSRTIVWLPNSECFEYSDPDKQLFWKIYHALGIGEDDD